MTTDPERQTILIVDDVPTNIRVLDQLLKGAYDIRATTRGEEAIRIAAGDDPPDLILLDIIMPEMDGYEVCRRLKSDDRTRHIPLVFITSRSEEEEETRGFELGAVDYITKPFSPDIVRARVRTQMDLKRYRDHLGRTNTLLRRTLKKQEINIDLAKKILGFINHAGSTPRHIPLPGNRSLFVAALSVPCWAEGGDHYFVHPVNRADGTRKTIISLKDQSGHEVGCVLRSIISDLSHTRIIRGDPALGAGAAMSQLNTDICRSGLLGPENFFTAITAEIDHSTLAFRYVSAGHPPVLLVRDDRVCELPGPGETGANIPVGVSPSIPFTEGHWSLQSGDRLIFYTDGLTEMPLGKTGEMIDAARLLSLIRDLLEGEREAGRRPVRAATLMHRLLARVAAICGERVIPAGAPGGPLNTSEDDVTLLCLEVEEVRPFAETVWQPRDIQDLGNRIDDLCHQILSETSVLGYAVSEHAIRTVLTEAAVNAWRHGNRENPEGTIAIRRRYGNDLHLEIIDQGEGFDSRGLPDPTSAENLTKPSGRGVFLIRHLADEADWDGGGRHLSVVFHRRFGGEGTRINDRQEKTQTGPRPSTERKDAMEIEVTRQGEQARFTISGRIDEKGAEALKQRFREVNSEDLKEIVFDFRHVSHIGSAGIGKLLLFYKDLALKEGRLRIENVSQTLYELFTVLKLDTIITIHRA